MFERTRHFFQRLTRSTRTPTARGNEERRLWERFPSDREARIQLNLDDTDTVSAQIQDVSRGGIRLLTDRAIGSGTMIRVELPPLDESPHTSVLACVVHVRPASDSSYMLGCNFSMELSDADLQAVGAERVKPEEGDQRGWARVPAAGKVVYTPVNPPGSTRQAEIHNISPTGVAIRASEELVPGILLNLELQDQTGHTVVTIIACVVYLTAPRRGVWLAGCNFIRELYDEDLKALVAPRS
jgi:PilZ domain-containing protein